MVVVTLALIAVAFCAAILAGFPGALEGCRSNPLL